MFRKVGGMKFSNRAVSLIVIVAVLLAASGVGLLIRRARMGNSQAGPQAGAEVDDTSSQSPMSPHGLDGRWTADTPEERAKLREQRAQILKKMESLTEEEKEQFRARIRARYSGQRAGPRGFQNLSPEQREEMARRWQNMSEQEREALRKQIAERFRAVRQQKERAAQSRQEQDMSAGHGAEITDSEPNQSHQG